MFLAIEAVLFGAIITLVALGYEYDHIGMISYLFISIYLLMNKVSIVNMIEVY